jgi:hypothetical protein
MSKIGAGRILLQNSTILVKTSADRYNIDRKSIYGKNGYL